VSDRDPNSSTAAGTHGLFFHIAMLSLALLIVFPGFAWFGYRSSGVAGFWSAAIAGLVSWVGALTALLLVGLTRGTPAAVHATLLGTLFRTGSPLIVGLVLQQQGGQLARAGVFGMILCYYFVALLVETVLSVRLIGDTKQSAVKA
jgi:hypothetical protein